MKKIIPLLLALALLLLLGCGVQEPAEEQPDLIRIGFSQSGSESDWRIAHSASIAESFTEANGYELLIDNAMQKQDNQYLAIRNFIQQEVDYIILAPLSEDGWDKVLAEAKDAGIPVILVDRQINVRDDSLYVSWVGSDFFEEGRAACVWLEGYLRKQHVHNLEHRILHIQGTDNSTAQILRTKALNEAINRHATWHLAEHLEGDYVESKSYEVVRDYLKTDTDFDIIYCENDNMTFGAMKALDEAGITYGLNGQVTIISFDATSNALNDCLDGKINLCVECNPLHGPKVASIIQMLEQGKTPPRRTFLEETMFTSGSLIPEIVNAREY